MIRREAEGLIEEASALNGGKWISHSYNVAALAERIAQKAGMDSEKAYIYGLIHDIGRRNGDMLARHMLEGYQYLSNLGYQEEARICITHGFQYQNVDGIYGVWDCTAEEKSFVSDYLASVVYNDYDKLIQLCDALSLADRYCIAEEKMVKNVMRHGFTDTMKLKWQAIFDLKDYFDEKTGIDIYSLY